MPLPNYLLRDIIEWDIPNWATALAYWERHSSQDLASVLALEIGSRNGGLSLGLALQGAHVVCTDLFGPTQESIRKHTAHQVESRIDYAQLDALNIPHSGCFDVVLFKSVLGGIGRSDQREKQARAISEMFTALKPGGELWFAENLVASPLHQLLRRRWVDWGKDWRYLTIEEMVGFLSPFSFVSHTTVGFLGALGRTSGQRNLLGWVDRLGLNKVVPAQWRYIIIGVARKGC